MSLFNYMKVCVFIHYLPTTVNGCGDIRKHCAYVVHGEHQMSVLFALTTSSSLCLKWNGTKASNPQSVEVFLSEREVQKDLHCAYKCDRKTRKNCLSLLVIIKLDLVIKGINLNNITSYKNLVETFSFILFLVLKIFSFDILVSPLALKCQNSLCQLEPIYCKIVLVLLGNCGSRDLSHIVLPRKTF